MDTILQFASNFVKHGISVIPLYHRSKEPILRTWEAYKPHTEYSLLPSKNDLLQWFGSGWQNYGVVAGWCNLAFLDFDDFETFALWKSYMELIRMPMPFTVLSSRGAHVYVTMPGSANEKRRGVDVKFHGYVVGPGSQHPNGTQYVALSDFHLAPMDSIETILPVELFPRVASGVCANSMPAVEIQKTHTEYEAFSAAMENEMDLISKVKSAVRIENFFSDMKRTSADGRWYAALCPFHDDKNPSAWIDIKRQLFGCNTCGMKPMDIINLFARQHNISESAAVTELAREAGIWG